MLELIAIALLQIASLTNSAETRDTKDTSTPVVTPTTTTDQGGGGWGGGVN